MLVVRALYYESILFETVMSGSQLIELVSLEYIFPMLLAIMGIGLST